jgi:hypothetical protein
MMKTTKAITKPKKTSVAGKAIKNKKAVTIISGPGEEEIREKAKEIYLERLARGENGTAENDWHKAEEILKHSGK